MPGASRTSSLLSAGRCGQLLGSRASVGPPTLSPASCSTCLMHFKPPASLLSGPQLWLLHLAGGPHGSSLWKFPLGGFGKTASSSLPPLPLHLLRPQREPHCPHPGFSCDQGKYYLALLMFNAPTPSLATPQPGSLPKAEAAGRGQRGRAWSVGEMAELTDDGECVCVRVCACVCMRVCEARGAWTIFEG